MTSPSPLLSSLLLECRHVQTKRGKPYVRQVGRMRQKTPSPPNEHRVAPAPYLERNKPRSGISSCDCRSLSQRSTQCHPDSHSYSRLHSHMPRPPPSPGAGGSRPDLTSHYLTLCYFFTVTLSWDSWDGLLSAFTLSPFVYALHNIRSF